DRLVRADAVVDGLVAVHTGGEGSSVTDLIAGEMLVLKSLEEALDDAVGLGRAVAGTDVGELGPGGDVTSEGGRAEGGAVVGDDGNRQDLPGLRMQALLEQRVAEPSVGVHACRLQGGDGIEGGLGSGDRAGQRDLSDVVDHAAEPPDAAADRLELTEVGLPDAAAAGRRLDEHSAPGPSGPASLPLVALGQEEPTPGQGTRHRGHRDLVTVGLKERPELAMAPSGKGSSIAGR